MQKQKTSINTIATTIQLSAEQQNEFAKAIKTGIYKELHKKELITDAQLKLLLEMQN